MQGTGNDYVVLDGVTTKVRVKASLVRHLCDRHYGVGADGVILVLPPVAQQSDFRMRMFNPDGSEAEMCGNGIRCLGKFVYDHGLTRQKHPVIETLAGQKPLELFTRQNKVTQVRVAMGRPSVVLPHQLSLKVPFLAKWSKIIGIKVLLGNPHYVIFVKDIREFPVERYGPLIEKHSHFPNRTNVEFVQVINRHQVKQHTWERGAGETLACGTGATAVVAAGIFTKQLSPKVKVHLKGGSVTVEQVNHDMLYLTGPAIEVFSGKI